MKTKIKIISMSFLFVCLMTLFINAKDQKEKPKKCTLELVDLNVKSMMGILGDEPTVWCSGVQLIKCEFPCCTCGEWLEAVDGEGSPSNPEGECPSCGAPLEDCDL